MNSPSASADSAMIRPKISLKRAICPSETPKVRMAVYSALPDSCDIATSAPISTASGISS
ncbi:hypothetical protein D3C72_1944630 [compost metagenome]